MSETVPPSLGVLAGKGVYPLELLRSARAQGVQRLFVTAFRGETARDVDRLADETVWLRVGQLHALLDALRSSGVRHAVMVGQITPTHLFNIRPDRAMLELLSALPARNAHTIFGAVAERLRATGVELLPAASFMASAMPSPGVLGPRAPDARERADMALGLKTAKAVSALEIGQTVVVKEGAILAVEAFEGTDETLKRAGRLGGRGAVAVKVAKRGHDMRFDIPVVGERTLRLLAKIGASALAVEAGRTILLERERLIEQAARMNLAWTAETVEEPS